MRPCVVSVVLALVACVIVATLAEANGPGPNACQDPRPVAGFTPAAGQVAVPPLVLTDDQERAARSRFERLLKTAVPIESRAAAVIDDFEDGDYVGWGGPGSGTCTAEVDTIGAGGTSRSLRIDGACGLPGFGGMYWDMGAWAPTGLHLYLRPGNSMKNDTYFVASDGASRGTVGTIFFYARDDGRFIAMSDVPYDCGPYVPSQWYNVSFTIDWDCQVFDVYIDGVLKQFNVPLREYFDQTPDNIQYLDFFHFDSSTGWWDEIAVSAGGVGLPIFEDGFERGMTCGWSAVSP